jgi:3-phytase
VLKVVESIALDMPNRRLLIAEELETGSHIKVYTPEGKFTGQIVGQGLFPHQAEGIILYACGDSAGYWVATDQDLTVNTFHVFDRATLRHLGSFRGDSTLNTDGIALTQRGFGKFPSGAFYAVHNDGNVAAFSWVAIADALGLRKDCGDSPAGAAEPAS